MYLLYALTKEGQFKRMFYPDLGCAVAMGDLLLMGRIIVAYDVFQMKPVRKYIKPA